MRGALLAVCLVLSACGGGGGGGPDTEPAQFSPVSAPASQPPAVNDPTPAAGLSPAPVTPSAPTPDPVAAPVVKAPIGIAVWGDSLSNYTKELQALYPDRVVYNGSRGGETSTQIAARQLAETTGTKGWINVFCYGRNNPGKAIVLADLARSIASLEPGNDMFIVLPILNGDFGAWEALGGVGYANIMEVNDAIAVAYPDHYFDMRAYLVSRFDPNSAQDLIDVARDVPPSSVRWDQLHLNQRGADLVAARLKVYIDAHGW